MADTKTTALTSFTAAGGDLLYGVDDPGGTPTSGKIVLGASGATLLAAATSADVLSAAGLSALSDPGANAIWAWNDTSNTTVAATIGSGLSFNTGTNTLSASGATSYDASASPSTPAAGFLGLTAVNIANRPTLVHVRENGRVEPVLFRPGETNLTYIQASLGSTTLGGLNSNMWAGTGTATGISWTNTSRYLRTNFLEYLVTVASTTAVAGGRLTQRNWSRGSSANTGGFFAAIKFSLATGVASTTRAFVGLYGTAAAPTDVEPSSLTNIIGVGFDAADTQWQFMVNDGAGTATKTAAGASFARPTADRTNIYQLFIYCPPNGSTVYMELWDDTTGVTPTKATFSASADIPANTAPLTVHAYHSVGGVSSVIGFALAHVAITSGI